MLTKSHHHFLLNFNPLPVGIRVSAFNLVFSVLIFFKFHFSFSLYICVFYTIIFSMVWWVIYRKEFSLEGQDSYSLEEGLKFSMVLFISSEIFFFFSFFWSYFHFFLGPIAELRLSWPPVLIESFDFTEVPLINTLVLLTSGATVTISHYFLNKGNFILCSILLAITFFLGGIFSFLQWLEYRNSFFRISDSTFGTSFFMLTGFHGLHVLIGSIFLLVVFFRVRAPTSRKFDCSMFELASWYWHFVDVVWLFLYFCLYYIVG